MLAREGVTDPLWYEVAKSRKAPKYARRALAQGAEVLFVWGGDGTVQRCIDAVAGTQAVLAIVPAGTANLLAENLQIPADITEAVRVGLYGERRPLDTGSVNGEHFAVMAGAGFDARMIKEADRGMKSRIGRAAYLYAGARNLSARRVKAAIDVDGSRFFTGRVSCVLVGNVSKILGGIEAFSGRRAPRTRRRHRQEPGRVDPDAGAARAGSSGEVAVRGGHQRQEVPGPVRPGLSLRA
jgi:diacylglycerol kinase family enzyme